LRADLAREAGLPPHYIFTHETLECLARERPETPLDLASIKGIGPSKLERYGSALLETIRSAARTTARTAPMVLPPSAIPSSGLPLEQSILVPGEHSESSKSSSGEYVSTEEWTWRLLERGFTVQEAAAIRGLELSAIIRHATWVARQGRCVPMNSFLPDERLALWKTWRHEHGDRPPPDAESDLAIWSLFLACILQRRPVTDE
jgi:ATP-dependent DNA helicase RecQ